MDEVAAYLNYKGAVVAAFAAAVVALELRYPAVRPLARTHLDTAAARLLRWAKNLSLFAVNAGMSPLVVIPLSALAARWALPWRPDWWLGWSSLALDLLLLDLWIYWWHRFNHELPFLWRFHQVHHLDEFLDASTAVRFHFGEVLLSAATRACVIVLLAVPLFTVVIFETLLLLATLFHHSNIRLPPALERALSRLLVTPSIHWVHHHAVRADTDSNYSTVLSVWDRIFASRSPAARTAAMEIGVERQRDESLLRLLVRPFGRNAR